jgi:hypothetical protein
VEATTDKPALRMKRTLIPTAESQNAKQCFCNRDTVCYAQHREGG